MKKKLIILLSIIVLISVGVCLFMLKNDDNKKENNFYLKYEYRDYFEGKVNQVIEITDLNYDCYISIKDHYNLEDLNETDNGLLDKEKLNDIVSLIKTESSNWKKLNKKLKKFVNNTTDMPSEHLIIKSNGVTFELAYLPFSIKSNLESALDKNIFGDIEREYNKSSQSEQNQKFMLDLPHHVDIQEDNEKTLNRKTEVVNIKNLKLESIEKSNLRNYSSKLQPIIDFIKKKYPNFDVKKWNVMCNMYSEDGSGILKINYVINEKIETNKSIFFTIENNNIVLANFINIDLNADENKVFEEIKKFESLYEQQKKEFASNEEFISEETYYTYFYNLDKLIYTYQLYFYESFGNEKIINNSYVSEYVVNEKSILVEV